jgi:phosphodiesterase/alkaline phosphatase D-like protein
MIRSFNLTAALVVCLSLVCPFVRAQTVSPGFTALIGGSVGSDPGPIQFSSSRDVHVVGNYAYLITLDNDLIIVDLSVPQTPVAISQFVNGTNGALMTGARGIFVLDDYAYVAASQDHSLEIIDVSNPLLPVHAGSISDGLGGGAGAELSGAVEVIVVGNYAYVAAQGALEIIDVTDKELPTHEGKVTGIGMGMPAWSLDVVGNYAYVATSVTITIIDVSDPTTPAVIGVLQDGDNSGAVKVSADPGTIHVVGSYLYHSARSYNSLEIFDISNPASPTPVGSIANGGTPSTPTIVSPNSVFVSGNYAFITNPNNDVLEIVDVSNPSAPTHATKVNAGSGFTAPFLVQCQRSLVVGNYIYLASGMGLEVLYLYTPSPPRTMSSTSGGPNKFTANWQTVHNATGYELDVSADNFSTYLPGFEALAITAPTISTEITGLTPITSYQYRIRALNANGASGNSLTVNTSTTTVAPVPTLASLAEDSFTITWDALAGATEYNYAVSNNAEFTNLTHIQGTTTATEVTATQMVPATTYYFGVNAVSAGGGSELATLTIITVPHPPTIEDPDVDFITQTSFKMTFVAAPGAGTFFVDVATDNNFTSMVDGYDNIQTTVPNELTVEDLSPNTTYYVRMRGVNAGGPSANSAVEAFLTLPEAPAATAATSPTQGTFVANWATMPAVEKYFIDVAADASFDAILTNYNNRQVTPPTILQSVTGLTAGTTYYYRVRCSNATGTSPNSNTITAVTLPLVPTTNAAQSITTTSFSAEWVASAGATNYYIDVATDDAFTSILSAYSNVSTGDVTTIAVSGLAPGTSYYYRVRAENTAGTTANSAGRLVVTAVSSPAASASDVTANSFTLSWNSVAGAVEYKFDLATDNTFAVPVTAFFNQTTTATSVNFTGLVVATNYFARVYAKNSAGVLSPASTTVTTLTLPSAPTIAAPVTADITASSFKVVWTGPGASSWFVDVATDEDFMDMVSGHDHHEVTGSPQLLVNTGLLPNTPYYVRVRSSNASGESLNSATENFTTRTEVPLASISAVAANTFTLSWSDVGATEYRYDLATDNAFAIPVTAHFNQTTTGTSVNITGLLGSTTYYARVYGENSVGLSTVASLTVSALTVPNPPTLNAATDITLTSFKITWSAPGATAYFVDIATDEDFTGILDDYNGHSVTGAALLQVSSVLEPNTVYYVRIRGSNATGSSLNSNTLTVLTLADALTANPATNPTQSSFQANWTGVPGASKYFVDVSENEDFNPMLTSYNNREVTAPNVLLSVTGLNPGTVYYYRVQSANTSGTSPESNAITAATLPVVPTLNNPQTITQTSFVATWSASPGATDYFLDVATNDTFASILTGYDNKSVGALTTTTITGLTTNTAYYYRVRAANLAGSTTSTPGKLVVTAPTAPVGSPATNVTQTSFTANWNAVTDITDYSIDVSTVENFISLVVDDFELSGGATSQEITGLIPGTVYYYRVRATNATAASAPSDVVSQITIPPDPTTAVADPISQTSFTVNWVAANGATGYSVDVLDENDDVLAGYENVLVTTGTSLVVDAGVEAGTSYSFIVRAWNDAGTSGNSSARAILTVPPTPIPLSPGISGRVNFSAKWEMSQSATKYFISVARDPAFGNLLPGYSNFDAGNVLIATITVNADAGGEIFYYKVSASNASGISPFSEAMMVNTPAVEFPSITFPTGGTIESYRIISIPAGTSATTALSDDSFAKTWRIMHYDNAEDVNIDVPDLSQLTAGLGYWINSNIDPAPTITVTGETTPGSKTLTLAPGWNQIGNPFNFDVSWADVLAKNSDPTTIGELYTYNVPNDNTGFDTYDGLKQFGGGFVNNTGATLVLTVPPDVERFTARRGGRFAINSRDISADEWFIPLTLQTGGKTNDLGGFGMHPDARPSIDKFDAVALPRFFKMAELTTLHPEFFQPRFMKDVVPTAESQVWRFEVNTADELSDARLTWDNTDWGDAVLYLIDDGAGALVDMSQADEYAFDTRRTKSVRFAFSRNGQIMPDVTSVGQPFPNPSAERVTFPFIARQGDNVTIQVIDLTGRSVGAMKIDSATAGYQEAIWDAKETGSLPPGVYLYQFTTSAGVRRAGRIVLK